MQSSEVGLTNQQSLASLSHRAVIPHVFTDVWSFARKNGPGPVLLAPKQPAWKVENRWNGRLLFGVGFFARGGQHPPDCYGFPAVDEAKDLRREARDLKECVAARSARRPAIGAEPGVEPHR
jgi:hypothetical protein